MLGRKNYTQEEFDQAKPDTVTLTEDVLDIMSLIGTCGMERPTR